MDTQTAESADLIIWSHSVLDSVIRWCKKAIAWPASSVRRNTTASRADDTDATNSQIRSQTILGGSGSKPALDTQEWQDVLVYLARHHLLPIDLICLALTSKRSRELLRPYSKSITLIKDSKLDLLVRLERELPQYYLCRMHNKLYSWQAEDFGWGTDPKPQYRISKCQSQTCSDIHIGYQSIVPRGTHLNLVKRALYHADSRYGPALDSLHGSWEFEIDCRSWKCSVQSMVSHLDNLLLKIEWRCKDQKLPFELTMKELLPELVCACQKESLIKNLLKDCQVAEKRMNYSTTSHRWSSRTCPKCNCVVYIHIDTAGPWPFGVVRYHSFGALDRHDGNVGKRVMTPFQGIQGAAKSATLFPENSRKCHYEWEESLMSFNKNTPASQVSLTQFVE